MDSGVSREDRRLMRRRGAGARAMEGTNFGFRIGSDVAEVLSASSALERDGQTQISPRQHQAKPRINRARKATKYRGDCPKPHEMDDSPKARKRRRIDTDIRNDISLAKSVTKVQYESEASVDKCTANTVIGNSCTNDTAHGITSENPKLSAAKKPCHVRKQVRQRTAALKVETAVVHSSVLDEHCERTRSGESSRAPKTLDNIVDGPDAVTDTSIPVRRPRGRPRKVIEGNVAQSQTGEGAGPKKRTKRKVTKPQEAENESQAVVEAAPTSSGDLLPCRGIASTKQGTQDPPTQGPEISGRGASETTTSTETKATKVQVAPERLHPLRRPRTSSIQRPTVERAMLSDLPPNVSHHQQAAPNRMALLKDKPKVNTGSNEQKPLRRVTTITKIERRGLTHVRKPTGNQHPFELEDYGEVKVPLSLQATGLLRGKWKF